MKTTVVCGLLGAGKTSFIKNNPSSGNGRTVVLVNDFGQAGIDGEILSAVGLESVELPSGCVCCSLKFDLIATIQNIIKQFSPEHLMIEPSGIASPSGVLEAVAAAGLDRAAVIGIVDVTEFSELYRSGMYGGFFEDQIVQSHVILLNKTDLAGAETIAKTERLIESINPHAVLFKTVNGFLPEKEIPLPAGERDQAGGAKRYTHFHFETLSFDLKAGVCLDDFERFFDLLAAGRYGTAVRAKALISSDRGAYRFDSVYGKVDRAPFERDIANSRLVVIGEKLDKQMLREFCPGSPGPG